MRNFRELRCWRHAHALTLELYKVTKSFPADERYGLTAQIRRSAASICANIAEGSGRRTWADFSRFLQIALGSASELEYHVLLAADLGLVGRKQEELLAKMVTDVKRMLTGFIRKLMADG